MDARTLVAEVEAVGGPFRLVLGNWTRVRCDALLCWNTTAVFVQVGSSVRTIRLDRIRGVGRCDRAPAGNGPHRAPFGGATPSPVAPGRALGRETT
jgi:hypothetical protein